MLYFILVIALAIVLIFRSIRSRFSNNSYIWGEILWPFNSAPKQIYACLSPENKGAFWSLTSSIIIAVLSCWLGFSVQYFVFNSTQSESDKLARYQIIDKFRPLYMEMYDTCTMPYFEEIYRGLAYGIPKKLILSDDDYLTVLGGGSLSKDKENSVEAHWLRFLSDRSNWDDISHAAKRCIDVSHSIAPYLDNKSRDKLLLNNVYMLINVHLTEALLNTSTLLDSLSFVNKYVDEYITLSIKDIVPRRDDLYELYGTAYGYYKNNFSYRSVPIIENKELARRSIQMTNIPLMENIQIITKALTPQSTKEKTKPIWISLIILILCLFIGYMIFRIIIMRFLDPKSMKPNPQKSLSDLQKIERELEMVRKELRQTEINIISLSAELKREQEHSQKCEDVIKEYKDLINNYQTNIETLKSTIISLKGEHLNDNQQIEHVPEVSD